ncbi:MAG: hypothetical protein GY870_18890 [archaeon]|nr:hypothetical protein [archaeon]
MGTFVIGPSLSFILVLMGDTYLDPHSYMQLSYFLAPIAVAIGVYVGLSMVNPKLIKKVLPIYIIAIPIYEYLLFFTPETLIESQIIVSGELIDASFIGIMRILNMILLFSWGIVMITAFSWLARKTTGFMKKKSIMQIIGYVIFLVCGVLETLLPIGAFLGVVRILLAFDYFLLYLAFNLTEKKKDE